jgi:hypothetical protein
LQANTDGASSMVPTGAIGGSFLSLGTLGLEDNSLIFASSFSSHPSYFRALLHPYWVLSPRKDFFAAMFSSPKDRIEADPHHEIAPA